MHYYCFERILNMWLRICALLTITLALDSLVFTAEEEEYFSRFDTCRSGCETLCEEQNQVKVDCTKSCFLNFCYKRIEPAEPVETEIKEVEAAPVSAPQRIASNCVRAWSRAQNSDGQTAAVRSA